MGERVGRGPLDLLVETRPLRALAGKRASVLAALLRRSGEVGNATALAAGSVRRAVAGELLALPAAVGLACLTSPLWLLLCLVPLGALASPEVRLRDRAAQRREGVERELPFFSAFLGVLGGAGVPLYEVLKVVASRGVFPSMKREALLAKRDVEMLGMDTNSALERLASSHPSKEFAEFVLGYTSKARSGGDVSAYLSSESGRLLRDLGERWDRYVAGVGLVGSLMVTVFGVVPLLLMVVGVFSPAFSTAGLVLYTGAGVPAFTAGLLLMAARMQPAQEDGLRGDPVRGALAAVPLGVAGFLVGGYWVSAAAGLIAFFLLYGGRVARGLAERRSVDAGVSKFLRDLLEYARQDYDLSRAVVAMESAGGYPGAFGRLLSRVAAQLRTGVPLDEVRAECGSRMGRLSFLLLGEMSRSGGSTVDTVFQVSTFADRLIELRKRAAAEMRPYLVLSYVSPVLLAFGITFVGAVLTSFHGAASRGVATLGLGVRPVSPRLTDVSDLLIVVSAASLGVIGAKIGDFTVRNTVRGAVNVAVAAGAVAAVTLLGSHSLLQLFRI